LRKGTDVLQWICNHHPRTAVIMLPNNDQPLYRRVCLTIGVTHFFDKSSGFENLHHAGKTLLAT